MATAENANNLGAPAQGFGQDVTFAVRPGDVPSQRDVSNAIAQPVQAGVEGGDQQTRMQDHTIVQKAPEDHTFEMLMKAGAELLEPKLKEARTRAFVSGMQRAAGGEAITDIVDNQPWYTRIFGDSDAVAGARAYTGHAQAAAAVGTLEDQMPTLRAMSPKEAQAVFTKTINSTMTGDAGSDMQIMSTLNAQLPGLMRRHAKEHYGWQQNEAAKAEAHSMQVGAAQLQQSATGMVTETADGQLLPGPTKPDEFKAQRKAWVRSIAPPAGRDAANWQITTTKTLNLLAEQGMFHALQAFDEEGGFAALTSEQATSIKAKWESEEKSKRALNEGPYMKQIADIRAGLRVAGTDGQTINDYIKRMQDVNSAYTARTGSRLGIFTPEQMTDLVTQGVEGLRRDRLADYKTSQAEAKAARTEAEKDAKRVRGVQQLAGQLEQGWDNPDFDSKDRREAWKLLEGYGPDRYFGAAIKSFQTKGTIDTERSAMMKSAAQVSIAAVNPTAVLTMYRDQWLPLHSGYTKDAKGNFSGNTGAGVADGYMGDELGKKMRVFHNIMRQGPEFALSAFNTAFVLPTRLVPLSTDKDDKQLRKDVASLTSYTTPEWWGGSEEHGNVDLRPDQVAMVSGMAKKTVRDEMIDAGDHEDSTRIALDRLKRQGLRTLGGFAWIEPEGVKPFSQTIDKDVPINRTAAAFRDTVAAKVKAAGLDDDQVSLMRDNDSATGTARFVMLVTSGGEQHVLTLTGDEVVATYKTPRDAKAARRQENEATELRLDPNSRDPQNAFARLPK